MEKTKCSCNYELGENIVFYIITRRKYYERDN